MRKVPFETGQYYHVFNRGVDKREIFHEKSDYDRFMAYLVIFNDEQRHANPGKNILTLVDNHAERKQIVDIVCFCVMPNHYHLIIKQIKEKGISLFLQKVGDAYTKYYNTKYAHSGVIFQGKTKNKLIDCDSYLLHLSRYIHLNPAGLVLGNGKTIENYGWSSYKNYIDLITGESLILSGVEIIKDQFKDSAEYKKFVESYNEEEDYSAVVDLLIDER